MMLYVQEQGEYDDEREVRQAIEELDEVGQPEILAAFTQHSELGEVFDDEVLFGITHWLYSGWYQFQARTAPLLALVASLR